MNALVGILGILVGLIAGPWIVEWHARRSRRRDALDALAQLESDLRSLAAGISASLEHDAYQIAWTQPTFNIQRMQDELRSVRALVTSEEYAFFSAVIVPMEIVSALADAPDPSDENRRAVEAVRDVVTVRLAIERSRGFRSFWPWSGLRRKEEDLRQLAETGLAVLDSGGFTAASPCSPPTP